MGVTHPAVPVHAAWAVSSDTTMVVLTGRHVDKDLTPVVFCHSFPGSATPRQIVDTYLAFGVYSLAATGRTVIVPAAGANWGHPTTSYPSGGTGLGAIDDALAVAVSMGLRDRAHLLGVSMGGLNALRWAQTNSTRFGAARLLTPVVDMMAAYDLDEWPSLAEVWSTGGRSAFAAATADVDPARNPGDYTAMAARISIFGARDDEAVPWAGLWSFAAATGIDLTPSAAIGANGGGHTGWIFSAEYDEYDALRLFDANE